MRNFKKVRTQIKYAQLFAVLLWFLISVIQWSQNPKSNPGVMIPLIIRGTEAFSILLVTAVLIWIIENSKFKGSIVWVRFLLLVVLYPCAILASLISIGIRSLIGYSPPTLDSFFFTQTLHFYIPMLLVLVISAIIKAQLEITKEHENKLQAEALAQQSRWMMLRYQVNPHFLFNALNSIRALIGEDDENARRIVTELSEYFRYSLTRDKATMVSLEEEITAVRSYLEIQKIRFRDKLNLQVDMDPDALSCAVPVFSVQTLVENAIKYGMKTSRGALSVKVFSEIQNEKLSVSVINSGSLMKEEPGEDNGESSHTGLVNLNERLKHLDPGSSFSLHEEDGQVYAQLFLTVKSIHDEALESPDC